MMRQIAALSLLVGLAGCGGSDAASTTTTGDLDLVAGMTDPPAVSDADLAAAVDQFGREGVDRAAATEALRETCEDSQTFGGALGLADAPADLWNAMEVGCPAQFAYASAVVAVADDG